MKFDINRSVGWNLDRAKMSITDRIYDGADSYPWRETFAFWPVKTISGKYVWLRKVYKRKFWVIWGTGFHMEPAVQYATAFDLLTCNDKDTFKS